MSLEKVHLGGYDSTLRYPQLVDQSSVNIFRLMPEKLRQIMYLADFEDLHPFRRHLPLNFEVDQNWAKFWMLLAPKFFLGGSPEILDRYYKIKQFRASCKILRQSINRA